jgi:hypothetical protein
MERIEGVIKGLFKGGGYIQANDGQLYIYYDSSLKEVKSEVLKKLNRVVAIMNGVTIIEVNLKEERISWADASLIQSFI